MMMMIVNNELIVFVHEWRLFALLCIACVRLCFSMFHMGRVAWNKADGGDDDDYYYKVYYYDYYNVTGTISTTADLAPTGLGRQMYPVWRGTVKRVMENFVLRSYTSLDSTAALLRRHTSLDTSKLMSSIGLCCVIVFRGHRVDSAEPVSRGPQTLGMILRVAQSELCQIITNIGQ